MLKNLKLGVKIGGGFGILIVISLILGGMAVINMSSSKKQAEQLSEEYVPEVEIANGLEKKFAFNNVCNEGIRPFRRTEIQG